MDFGRVANSSGYKDLLAGFLIRKAIGPSDRVSTPTSDLVCLLLGSLLVCSVTSLMYADLMCAGTCSVVDLDTGKTTEAGLSLLHLFALPSMKMTFLGQSLFLSESTTT